MSGHKGASIPIVELRIQAMGEHIITAVALRADEIAERVRSAVEHTVKHFDFESYVREETESFLRTYMSDGAGGDAVRDLAAELGESALNKILKRNS